GLNPGAPVKFRGVTIGSVVEILIRHNQAAGDFSMPVVITIDKKLAQSKSDQLLQVNSQSKLDHLISQGFRARLDSESLVTGVLYIALDIVPDAPPPLFHQLTAQYSEIPTMPSQIQQLLEDLAHLDLHGLSEKLGGILTRVDVILSPLDDPAINAGVTKLLVSANHLVNAPDLTNSFASLKKALDQAGVLLKHVDGRVDPLADSITNTLYDAQKTLGHLRVALQGVSGLIGPDSPIPSDLKEALENFS